MRVRVRVQSNVNFLSNFLFDDATWLTTTFGHWPPIIITLDITLANPNTSRFQPLALGRTLERV
jgi:hypothetical protein